MRAHLAAAVLFIASCTRTGDPCASDEDCGDLVCHRATYDDGGVAAAGICGYPLFGRGEMCAATAECGEGLFCSNDLPAEIKQRYGECIDLQPVGEPCFREANCQPSLECRKTVDSEIGTCEVRTETQCGSAGIATK